MSFSFVNAESYLALPRDPQQWVIQHLIPVGGLTNIYGKPKAGKSFAALGMAHAVSADEPEWLGFAVMKHGPVAYLQIDTPRGEWAFRILKMKEAGLDISNMFVADMSLAPFPFDILDTTKQEWLRQQMDTLKPVLVIIDTIRELHGSDENDSTAMRNVVTSLVAACRPAAVVLLSHSRKDNMFTAAGGDDLMSDARGSSYVAGRMDVVIKMTTNGKHASGMTYKGRSVGQGRVVVKQSEDTGLILLDGDDAQYWVTLKQTVNRLYAEDPTISVRQLVLAVREQTTYKADRQTRTDVETHLLTLGWSKPKRQAKK